MNVLKKNNAHVLIIIVAALGYFVDIYDLTLFGVVKKESLEEIMVNSSAEQRKDMGVFLLNMQMAGMLVGGIIWGVWGDKKGRLSVLFGSILLYSIANVANAFVTSVEMYAIVRVIAGIGLAGELGAGITLVSETMPKEKRGYGTMIIVTFGALGAVVAFLVSAKGAVIGEFFYAVSGMLLSNWQVAYVVGGIMGLLLLFLRIGTLESGMYKNITLDKNVKKGDFRIIFSNRKNFTKYLYCILVGIPIWYVVGLLVMNSEEMYAKIFGISGVVNGRAMMYAYIGLSVGDLISGLLSQILKSRRKVVFIYLLMTFVFTVLYLFFSDGISLELFYLLCFMLGISTGYWAIFVTIAAEQFGTNIRSTVTNTVPNFVRGSLTLVTGLFGFLTAMAIDTRWSSLIVGVLFITLAWIATWRLKESFSKDLNYIEGDHHEI